MSKTFKAALAVVAGAATLAGVVALPSIVSAWGDNSGNTEETMRPSYTYADIKAGALEKDKTYPGTIVFNSISDSEPIGGDEKNFVAARECVLQADNTCESKGLDNQWKGNDITAEDGKTYLIRLYVHNNNPHELDAIAHNVKVWFNVPTATGTKVEVNGFINHDKAENTIATRYWDYINFNSVDGKTPFKLIYEEGSAKIINNGAVSGSKLTDNIVQAAAAAKGDPNGGALIGIDKLDGEIPGCYNYASYISIRVKAVYDYDFTVNTQVRLAGEREWKNDVVAKVGDKVEFQITYTNTGDTKQNNVGIRDILPSNLRYVAGSTKLMNTTYKNGVSIKEDYIVSDGILIGNYEANGGNAFVMFTAEVVDDNLACGNNTLVNWGQAGVGTETAQDYARVITTKTCDNTPVTPPTTDPEPETPELPKTGPETVIGGVMAAGSIATAAGYYIVSRRQLR